MREILAVVLAGLAWAAAPGALPATTHGDKLLGAGAASRALGGVGVAVAPDAAGAVFSNPATLAFLTPGATGEIEMSAAFFQPAFEGRAGGATAESDKIYALPTVAAGASGGAWSYGFAVYVVSGLGGDYRDTAMDTNLTTTPFPLVATTRAELQVVEFAPAVAWRFSERFSAGLAATLDHGSFNLGRGERHAVAGGLQPGVVFRPAPGTALGVSGVVSSTARYSGLFDFDNDGTRDAFRLRSPTQARAGVSHELAEGRLRIEADARWFGWSDAAGYGDFGWRDAWLLGVAVEHTTIPERLTLRAAYNFGPSPVEGGAFNGVGAPGNVIRVQGKAVPAYYYEAFRVISFPAVAEHHLALGIGWRFGAGWRADFTATYSPASTIEARGTDLLGRPTVFESRLTETSVELGLSRRY